MTNNQRLEIEDLLNSYDLSHRFIVRYAVACATTVKSEMTAEGLKALALAERYGAGEDIPKQELRDAADDAYTSYADYAAWSADSADYAANAAAWSAYAAFATHYASYAAYYASAASKSNKNKIDYKQMLLDMIHSEYTEFELLMMGCSNESISA